MNNEWPLSPQEIAEATAIFDKYLKNAELGVPRSVFVFAHTQVKIAHGFTPTQIPHLPLPLSHSECFFLRKALQLAKKMVKTTLPKLNLSTKFVDCDTIANIPPLENSHDKLHY